jgi:hypothetical protein
LTHYLIFKLPKPEKKLSKDANLISKSGLRSSLKPDSKYISMDMDNRLSVPQLAESFYVSP